MYKICNGETVLDDSDQRLIPARIRLRTSHEKSFEVPHSRANYHKYSYVPRTIRDWNDLPANVVSAPTLNVFKRCLSDLKSF